MTLHIRNRTASDVAALVELRGIIQRAQWHICPICGEDLPLNLTLRPDWRPSFDHVWPLVTGGRDGLGNIVVVHQHCNSTKAGRRPTGCELVWLMAVNARVMG